MSKVLFTHSYFYKLDPKQWKFKQPYPPIGTLQAASVIRNSGFDVSIFDVGLRDKPEEIYPILKNNKPDYFIIYDDGFNYLTKMCLTVMREAAFAMAEYAKQQGCIVIINSSDSTDHYEKYFLHGVDYVVRGEGEETLKELLNCIEQKKDVALLNGIAFLTNGKSTVTSARSVLRDLDSLPLPAWNLIDVKPYQSIWKKHHGYFSLNLATTRGCPYKCNWCAKPIYGNRYNSRSPEHVIKEIEFLLKEFHPDHFWMCDDIFGLKPDWVKRFSLLVKQSSLSFRYKIQSRVDLLLEENTIQSLAESGCDTVWVGAESGSQKILDAMDKGTTVQQIYDATKLLKQNNIKVGFFLQFGYPGETQEDIDATLEMLLDILPDEVGISISYPLPGTKFYEKVKDQLSEKQNWKDSDDLALMFESAFNSVYYKKLHRYVHSKYRIKKGFKSIKKFFHSPLKYSLKDSRAGLAAFYYLPVSIILGKSLNKMRGSML